MSTYPTLPTRVAKDKPRYGREIDEATNGSLRGRQLHNRRRAEFQLVHPHLSAAQKDALFAFLDANPGQFIYTRQRETLETYTVILVDDPVPEYEKGGYYTVSLTLRECV